MTRVKLNICLKDFPTPKSPLLREVRWDGHSQIVVSNRGFQKKLWKWNTAGRRWSFCTKIRGSDPDHSF